MDSFYLQRGYGYLLRDENAVIEDPPYPCLSWALPILNLLKQGFGLLRKSKIRGGLIVMDGKKGGIVQRTSPGILDGFECLRFIE